MASDGIGRFNFLPSVEFVGLFGESDGSAHGCGQSMPIINGIYK
jgi:hypothetical protein